MRAQKNYQKMLEATIAGLKEQNRVPTLLLLQLLRARAARTASSICRSIFISPWIITTPIFIRKKSIICGCRSSSG